MCYHLRTSFGGTEAVIDDNCGISKFYSIAGTLKNVLKVRFLTQINNSNVFSWKFKYKDHILILQYSVFNGVSILPQPAENAALSDNVIHEISRMLVNRAY